MFCFILGEEAVDDDFFLFKIYSWTSIFFRFSTWKWLVNEGNHVNISNITISDRFDFFWFVIALLYRKSAILGLSFLNPKNLCLSNQFSRGSLQKRSVTKYLTWCQRRNWVASMIELMLIFNRIWTFSGQCITFKISLAFLKRIQSILE